MVEIRYEPFEKLAFAVVTLARRLCSYFQAHLVEIPTNYSLLQILHKPSVSGRLTKWVVKLRELDIKYVPTTTIKAQIIAKETHELTKE